MIDKLKRIGKLRNVQILLLVGLVIYIGIVFSMKQGSNTPFKEVSSNVEQVVDVGALKKAGIKELKRYYGLNTKDYENVMFYFSDSVMGVEELLLVKVKNDAQILSVEGAIAERVKSQKKSFEGYGAEQMKMLHNAMISTKGSYVFLAISPKAEKAQKAFVKSL